MFKVNNLIPGINFSVFQDSSSSYYLGGNKARKIEYLEKKIKPQFNAIVTTGGIQSNHCRVTALMCAKNNWKCTLILHGNKEKFYQEKGNALIMRMCGAETRFVNAQDIGSAMDKAMGDLKKEGYSPYYLYGGGHNKNGVEAYVEAIKELQEVLGKNNPPDHIFLASGTGSTQAGILLGLEKFGWSSTRVHGISVARKKQKGTESILEAIHFIKKDFDTSRIHFYDDFIFGGYGVCTKELEDFIFKIAKKSGVILDTTYTGKAFYGMMEIINKENYKGNILFWHTGGLLNLMA